MDYEQREKIRQRWVGGKLKALGVGGAVFVRHRGRRVGRCAMIQSIGKWGSAKFPTSIAIRYYWPSESVMDDAVDVTDVRRWLRKHTPLDKDALTRFKSGGTLEEFAKAHLVTMDTLTAP